MLHELSEHESPLPEYPALQVHVDVSVVVVPSHGSVTVAYVSQIWQGVQLVPDPKYPALQVHVDVSVDVLPVQAFATVANVSQILHNEQAVPPP